MHSGGAKDQQKQMRVLFGNAQSALRLTLPSSEPESIELSLSLPCCLLTMLKRQRANKNRVELLPPSFSPKPS